mmetsp:Transcript_9009/g.13233  ORF Transcript_9009/g.13233 Transcript_9009/m.13233 type:complete len:170 (+) Transcript_9009:207-716(+)|eukprot:CAMPEP_0197232882 /NCGR_PEP_ID=MMETSP1429-20130617/1094_1 /TAXON_ID=49237 /ORGANISM="Chaetoceros  sp., Strain UNC1202" /LENGTH=169 /DNA_ID=CAMNT_0042691023 /DNA_START=182 /DNA_END=691 /DNA_ORIENTATION=-
MNLSLLTLCAIFAATSGFTISPPRGIATRINTRYQHRESSYPSWSLSSSTVDTHDSKNTDEESSSASPEELAALEMKNQEMKEVREELVTKYLSAGKSQEFAEQEVDEFLSDPERSEKFLEMRRYAKAQANELMGFESILILGGAFFLGLLGTVGGKYLAASGEVPIPL